MNVVLAKALNSILKGLVGTLVAAAIVALNAFGTALPAHGDPLQVVLFGAIITGIHALISALEKYQQTKP